MLFPIQKLRYAHENYPKLLKEIHRPPDPLFCQGDLTLLSRSCLSVVGTRKFSDYGQYVAEKILSQLGVADIVIVSGLAKGIDAIAHKEAINNNLPTIAVLGTGIQDVYPEENIALAGEILESGGLIISEFFSQGPRKENFPRRNRIISGLCFGTLVIEAPEKSGALITANFALEQNREVFAIPADIDRQNSLGNLNLLYRGLAHAVSCGQDIIDIMNNTSQIVPLKKKQNVTRPNPIHQKIDYKLDLVEKMVYESMTPRRGTSLEKLSAKTGFYADKILPAISTLEISGLLTIKDGKYYRF